jgi:hypothetical protein
LGFTFASPATAIATAIATAKASACCIAIATGHFVFVGPLALSVWESLVGRWESNRLL